jgi:hypothetical protein
MTASFSVEDRSTGGSVQDLLYWLRCVISGSIADSDSKTGFACVELSGNKNLVLDILTRKLKNSKKVPSCIQFVCVRVHCTVHTTHILAPIIEAKHALLVPS